MVVNLAVEIYSGLSLSAITTLALVLCLFIAIRHITRHQKPNHIQAQTRGARHPKWKKAPNPTRLHRRRHATC